MRRALLFFSLTLACVATAAAQPPDADGPLISAYAIEPHPLGDEEAGGKVPYEAGVRVVNEGARAAEVARASVSFEVRTPEGERRPCTIERESEALRRPPALEPGGALDMTAVAVCPLSPGGEDEVLAYLTFEAADPGTAFDVERTYAGVRRVALG